MSVWSFLAGALVGYGVGVLVAVLIERAMSGAEEGWQDADGYHKGRQSEADILAEYEREMGA